MFRWVPSELNVADEPSRVFMNLERWPLTSSVCLLSVILAWPHVYFPTKKFLVRRGRVLRPSVEVPHEDTYPLELILSERGF